MNDAPANDFSLPNQKFLVEQSQRSAPARARLLRNVDIARRRSILDLGCGYGSAVEELTRRGCGRVIAFDRRFDALRSEAAAFESAFRICGDACRLPFADDAFDLIFCQFFFLWANRPAVFDEIARVLRKRGALTAVEPDFGGMIEYPQATATRDIWINGLLRAGADVSASRRAIVELRRRGFDVEVGLSDRIEEASDARFDWLEELPLDDEERKKVASARSAYKKISAETIAHLPLLLITATKQ